MKLDIGLITGDCKRNGRIERVAPITKSGLSKSKYNTLTQVLTSLVDMLIQTRTLTVIHLKRKPIKKAPRPM